MWNIEISSKKWYFWRKKWWEIKIAGSCQQENFQRTEVHTFLLDTSSGTMVMCIFPFNFLPLLSFCDLIQLFLFFLPSCLYFVLIINFFCSRLWAKKFETAFKHLTLKSEHHLSVEQLICLILKILFSCLNQKVKTLITPVFHNECAALFPVEEQQISMLRLGKEERLLLGRDSCLWLYFFPFFSLPWPLTPNSRLFI